MRKSTIKAITKKILLKAEEYASLSDESLAAKTVEFKSRLQDGSSLDSILVEAFAAMCEADRRVLGLMPFEPQIEGGIALHYGYLAEMNTGEGKTLTATLPLYLNALTEKSCILVTANQYLAHRDAREMGPVFKFMGLSVRVGVTKENENARISNREKKEIYKADIVYTTHSALGFDYLFDNLVKSAGEKFLRDFYYVIIDEADSVLLDAAQTPLVISGAPHVQANLYKIADFFVKTLDDEKDYVVDEKKVWLTDEGVSYAERYFDIENFYSKENFELNRHVTLALRAHGIFEREKDYIVSDENEIVLLNRETGRLLYGMKLRGGQHQALEVKEGLDPSQEHRSMASITYQNFFLLFPKMSGMSGTMYAARRELRKIYKKRVMVIPPNKPVIRDDYPDLFFNSAEEQFRYAIEEAFERHLKGQPVLLITSTIADTKKVSGMLMEKKVPHSVLNANNAFWEAQIIKEAGQVSAVTVSTGMAGRGTDIKLADMAKMLGGLSVIGIGRMANIRLEKQARGRAGRQGDPGCSRFYVSLEDDVAVSVGDKALIDYLEKGKRVGKFKLKRLINGAQRITEERAVSARKHAVDYDKVLNRQRNTIYMARNRLLKGENLDSEFIEKLIEDDVDDFVYGGKKPDSGEITRYILENFKYRVGEIDFRPKGSSKSALYHALSSYILEIWDSRQKELEASFDLKELVRRCVLHAIDSLWIEQVDYLQQLQFVVSGKATAGRNPLFEYYTEARDSFDRMQKGMKRDILRYVFLSKVEYDKSGDMKIWFP